MGGIDNLEGGFAAKMAAAAAGLDEAIASWDSKAGGYPLQWWPGLAAGLGWAIGPAEPW